MNRHPKSGTCLDSEGLRDYILAMSKPKELSVSRKSELKRFSKHLQECSFCTEATQGLIKWLNTEGSLPNINQLPEALKALIKS